MSISVNDLYNGKEWIHGNSNDIKITIFLITIQSNQLKYSLDCINNLDRNYPVLVNVIMNVSPTNKAYNQMRERCKTPYFIQLDEDMELRQDAIKIFIDHINIFKMNNFFLYTYKLIDNDLGIGNPPIIDSLKLYNNEIMQKYPTYNNGETAVSSVDYLWHNPILNNGYKINETFTIIGYHGNHRSNYDLFLRYCKITKSILDPNIKTNSGHISKLLVALHYDEYSISELLCIIANDFKKVVQYPNLDEKILKIYEILNTFVKNSTLSMYNIKNRQVIKSIIDSKNNQNIYFQVNIKKILCIVAMLSVITNNYEYSFDKYPIKIYEYFIGMSSCITNISKTYLINPKSFFDEYLLSKEKLYNEEFGSVWGGVRKRDFKIITVKIIPKQKDLYCDKEVSIIKNHEDMSGFIDEFEDQFNIYIVLEYIKGQNDYYFISPSLDKNLLNLPNFCFIIWQCIQAISAIYWAGSYRQDIKFTNFIVTFNNLSSESIMQKKYNIFSLGMLLVEILIKQPSCCFPEDPRKIMNYQKLNNNTTKIGIWLRSLITLYQHIDPKFYTIVENVIKILESSDI
jgi:hypothetical protein